MAATPSLSPLAITGREVNFVDFFLARLADPTLRPAIFDQDAMQQILQASYDTDAMQLEGPYSPVFDRLSLAMSVRSRTVIEGYWGEISDPHRNQVSLQVDALDAAAVRVDALWQGAIVAGTSSVRSRIESVSASWPGTAGIDDEIVQELGSLPSALPELEVERRKRLLARWRAAALQPEALTDAGFSDWLAAVGVDGVSQLMLQWPGLVAAGPMQLGFSASAAPTATRKPLPISAAILVRDAPVDLSRMLADSRTARDALDALGAVRPPDTGAAAARANLLVVWMVPRTVFDDPDWPGGDANESPQNNNALRTAAARLWLAQEAIAVLTLPAHPA